jgi:dihydroorotate dehydrogenase (fumarate)
MADLSTSYMGLHLQNPIIVASSDLSRNAEGIKKCEDAGAAAVVLKSIFEEQFLIEGGIPEEEFAVYPEALDYLRSGGLMEYAPHKICQEIEKAKATVKIPIIASINCQTSPLWARFARQIQEAGADGLELNIYNLPIELDVPGSKHEDQYVEILKEVKREITIPVSIKLVPQVSSLPFLTQRLSEAGCDAFVLFNWFLEPDIDTKNLKTYSRKGKGNFNQSLRWVALLADRIRTSIAASGGIQYAEDIVKQILAGAAVVQICSLFYQKGLTEIGKLLEGMESWMNEHQYSAIDDFRGELSFKRQELTFRDLGEAGSYFRAQYLKVYSK